MRFEEQLLEGVLVRRHKRFSAKVKLRSGDEIVAHCDNPGSLPGCSSPNTKVLLLKHNNERRRFPYQIEIMYAGRTAIGIHTGRPLAVLVEAISSGKVPELAGYASMRRDLKMSRERGVDLILEGNGLRTCYISVKNVTLAHEQIGYFPDATVEHGTRDMVALTDLVREGNRSVIVFLVQRADVETFRPADHIDPDFGLAFRDAAARGVEVLCHRGRVSRKGIDFDAALPVDLGN